MANSGKFPKERPALDTRCRCPRWCCNTARPTESTEMPKKGPKSKGSAFNPFKPAKPRKITKR